MTMTMQMTKATFAVKHGIIVVSLRKQPSFFAPGPSGVSREGRLRFTAENSILMTKICPASGHER